MGDPNNSDLVWPFERTDDHFAAKHFTDFQNNPFMIAIKKANEEQRNNTERSQQHGRSNEIPDFLKYLSEDDESINECASLDDSVTVEPSTEDMDELKKPASLVMPGASLQATSESVSVGSIEGVPVAENTRDHEQEVETVMSAEASNAGGEDPSATSPSTTTPEVVTSQECAAGDVSVTVSIPASALVPAVYGTAESTSSTPTGPASHSPSSAPKKKQGCWGAFMACVFCRHGDETEPLLQN